MNFDIDMNIIPCYTTASSTKLNFREGGEILPYNYSKLLGRITECCGTQAAFAKKIGLSERSVSLKLNGKRAWKQNEIGQACEILSIPVNQIDKYFFAL